MEYLSELENKYGRLPSILAARADFTRGAVGNEALLLEAFEIAERSSDPQAMLHIAHSLTELYVEDAWDRSKAAFWLRRFEALLSKDPDAFLDEELQQLRNAYQSASRRAGR